MVKSKGKIYKITNTKNNLVYIGCTLSELDKRFKEHLSRCFKSDFKSKLYNSIKKYGQENFNIELIEECELGVMYEIEKKYILQYDSYNKGLNSTIGGEGCLGYKHSEEIRKKISENTKNGNSHRGKTYDELYGDGANDEREKRRLSVKKGWDLMTDGEKEKRINNIKDVKQKNSKYGVELVREIKNKIKEGLKIKEFQKLYPYLRKNFFYELKNGTRWGNIN
jgi:group I intron endonuclease